MSRPPLALVITLILGVGVSCGGGGGAGGGDARETRPGQPRGTGWASELCAALDQWGTAVTQRLDSAAALDPAADATGVRQALLEAVTGAGADTTALLDALNAAGAPRVPDGDAISESVRDAISEAEAAFAAAGTALSALPLDTSDPATLIAGADAVGVALRTGLASARDALAEALALPAARRLTKAIVAAPACDELFA